MNYSSCKGCGARIIWVTTRAGKRIPLDPTPPVYEVTECSDGLRVARGASAREMSLEGMFLAVSHFATCSHANDFSGSRKEPKP